MQQARRVEVVIRPPGGRASGLVQARWMRQMEPAWFSRALTSLVRGKKVLTLPSFAGGSSASPSLPFSSPALLPKPPCPSTADCRPSETAGV